MGKVALVFAGQGVQKVGMGLSLAESSPAAASVLERADGLMRLGSLTRLLADGPQDLLDDTRNAQPALFAVDVAAFSALVEAGVSYQGVAGFSLGEYAAHVAAGTVSLDDALPLVEARAGFMADEAARRPGRMAAFLRGTSDEVVETCREAAAVGVVEAVNFNAPGQVVVSGEPDAVEHAAALWKARGYKSIPLATSGPFHSSLMRPAADLLEPLLGSVAFLDPQVPLYTNVDAEVLAPGGHVDSLTRQVYAPVRWESTIRAMRADGFDMFVECGPGGVLSGLIGRIDPEATCLKVEDAQTLAETLSVLT